LIRAVAYFNFGFVNDGGNIAPVLNPPTEKVEVGCDSYGCSGCIYISIEDFKGTSRRREISWARQIAMYLMRQHTPLSLPRIGEEFGKDHTTVLYSCDKITTEKRFNFAQTLRCLSDRINLASRSQNSHNQTQFI